jgi:ankyrin repeat protein
MLSDKLYPSALARKQLSGPKPTTKSPTLLPSFSKSSPGKVREWQSGKAVRLRYCQVGGEHGRYSITVIIRVYGLHTVEVQLDLSDPRESLIPSTILSVRGLIPQDAAIIDACKKGDSIRVRQLLTSREARPDDVTTESCTALSVSTSDSIGCCHLSVPDCHRTRSSRDCAIASCRRSEPKSPSWTPTKVRRGHHYALPRRELIVVGSSPIQIAVANDNLQIARLLLSYCADLQYCSAGSWSILHYLFDRDIPSSRRDYFSMFWDDLQFDDIRDPEGWTALHRCAAFGTADDVYMLVKLGASSFTDRYITTLSRSPIHIAAHMDNVSTLQALSDLSVNHSVHDGTAQRRAILETADINGWTPLHLAIYCKAMNTAKWLLDQKVDVHKRTYQTAIWFPKTRKNETFSVMDVAHMAGEKVLKTFSSLLNDAGYDITTDGSDIYW